MNIEETMMLDRLTKDGVSVQRQKFVIDDGTPYGVGEPQRKAYVNSIKGREEITQEISGDYLSAVMAMWGPEPTITEE